MNESLIAVLNRGPITVNGVLYSESIMVEYPCMVKQDKERLTNYCYERWWEARFIIEDEDTILVLIK
jgi:hypothetical protein